MTFSKYATLCALFAGSQANVQVTINSDKIKKFGMDYIQWIGGQAQDVKSQEAVKDLNNAAHAGQVRIDLNQKQIFGPVLKNIQTYLKFINQSNPACDQESFVHCAVQQVSVVGGINFLNAIHSECGTESKCNIKWDDISPEEKQNVMHKFGMNMQETRTQLEKVSKKNEQDFMQAIEKNAQQIMKVAEATTQKHKEMLKQWGCNGGCIDECTSSAQAYVQSKACSRCDCPVPFQVRMVSGVQHQFDSPTYDLSILGDGVSSLAAEEETTTEFTQADINYFKENNTFYKGIGVTQKDNGVDYQAPYFSFAPVEKSSWITPTAVLCSIGLVGAGYVAVTSQKQEQKDQSAFIVEMA